MILVVLLVVRCDMRANCCHLLYVPCCVRRAGNLSKSCAIFGRSGASHGEGSKLSLFLGRDKNRPSFAVFLHGKRRCECEKRTNFVI